MNFGIRRLSLILLTLATFMGEGQAWARIRVMSANLTSGRYQSYDPGHGAHIIHAMKPDVLMIQEFNYGDNSAHDIRQFVDNTLGKDYEYYREDAHSASIPNGIISRFPIRDSGVWKDPAMGNRGFSWAEIELPSGQLLWAYSVHLSSADSNRRGIEADALVQYIKGQADLEKDFITVGGDFNTPGRTEDTIKVLREIMGDETVPVGPDGKDGTNVNRTKPYDWVMANDALDQHAAAVDLRSDLNQKPSAYNVFPNGLVFDSRAFPANYFPGVDIDDSRASGMQHMSVVKEFDVN